LSAISRTLTRRARERGGALGKTAYCDVHIISLGIRGRVEYDTDEYVCANELVYMHEATSRCGDACSDPSRFRWSGESELVPLPADA
jgi:hypothetical protein